MTYVKDRETIARVTGVNLDRVELSEVLAIVCRRLEILERLFNDHQHSYFTGGAVLPPGKGSDVAPGDGLYRDR